MRLNVPRTSIVICNEKLIISREERVAWCVRRGGILCGRYGGKKWNCPGGGKGPAWKRGMPDVEGRKGNGPDAKARKRN